MQEIETIRSSQKRTPVKVYLWEKEPVAFPGCWVFPAGDGCKIIFGDWEQIAPILAENPDKVLHTEAENSCRNTAIPLLDTKDLPARIEPGAILRQGVHIGAGAVVMMGAIVNLGASIGENTMVDMGAVLGGRATVGKNCHIGAGAVLAGVIEPPSATPVVVEDDVLVGANAVILEGCRVGAGAVIAAGAVVTADVPANAVVAGMPARVIKYRDEKTDRKTAIVQALRQL